MPKSAIFFYFFLAFAAGIFIVSFNKLPAVLFFCPVLFFAAIIYFRKRNISLAKKAAIISFVVFSVLSGIFYYHFYTGVWLQKDNLSVFNDKDIAIKFEAVVDDEIKENESSIEIKASVKKCQIGENSEQARGGEKKSDFSPIECEGKILIIARKFSLPSAFYEQKTRGYGNKILVEGKLMTAQKVGDFDSQQYLKRDGIFSVMYWPKIEFLGSGGGNLIKEALFSIKNKFSENLAKVYPEPVSSFIVGILLGEKRDFSPVFKENLRLTGTTHLIALSGYNITVVSKFLMLALLALGFSRRKSFYFAAGGILLFVIMTGASASVVRAGIMGVIFLLAGHLGRIYTMTNSLFFAGFLMLLLNPTILYFDLAFGLSFLATMGLIYFTPYFERKFRVHKESILNWRSMVGKTAAATLSAQTMVLGLLIFKFKMVSLVSFLTNILILPFIPFSMFVGFAAGLMGFINPLLAEVFAWLSAGFLSYDVFIINAFAKIPYAAMNLEKFSLPFLVLYYAAIGYFTYLIKRRKNKEFSE